MSEISERLRAFINYKDLTVSAFEESIGVSNGYVKNISKGLGGRILERISQKHPELSRDWLLYGEGEMIKDITIGNRNAIANGKNCVAINGNNNNMANNEQVARLTERVELLEQLLAEKERLIQILINK